MKEGKCPHCGKDSCYQHCYANNNGKHEIMRGQTDRPYLTQYTLVNDGIIVDFHCRRCGQSGSALILPSDIQWD